MQKLKTLVAKIKNNSVEMWLTILLFIGIPLSVSLYTDTRGFFVTTVLLQSIVFSLVLYRGNK